MKKKEKKHLQPFNGCGLLVAVEGAVADNEQHQTKDKQ